MESKNIEDKTDDYIIERHEELIAELSKHTNGALDDVIGELLELERELTKREY